MTLPQISNFQPGAPLTHELNRVQMRNAVPVVAQRSVPGNLLYRQIRMQDATDHVSLVSRQSNVGPHRHMRLKNLGHGAGLMDGSTTKTSSRMLKIIVDVDLYLKDNLGS